MRKTDNEIHDFLIANQILFTPQPLIDDIIRLWGMNGENVYNHYSDYFLTIQQPESTGPIEKHPYIDLYDEDCNFQNSTLILGTFPPSSYMNNLPVHNLPNPNIQNNNPLHYFYGNMNSLWKYLFDFNQVEVTIPMIRETLKLNKFSISDVFAFVQRNRMISSSDQDYRNIVLNCRLQTIFDSNSRISTVLFTSGNLRSFFSGNISTLTGFRWIMEDCCGGLENFEISGEITGNGPYYNLNNYGIDQAVIQQNNGIIWWLKFNTKKIRIINLPSPSPQAAIPIFNSAFFQKWINFKANENQIPLPVDNNQIRNYINLYPGIFERAVTNQYRREVYSMVLNNSIHLI